MNERLQIIEGLAREMLELMGVEAEVQARHYEEMIIVNLVTGDAALLIGTEGETLDALQHVLRALVESRCGEFVALTVDTEGYRQRKMDRLEVLAARLASRVQNTGRAEALRPMSPSDRRIIHMKIKQIDGVVSESIGEGRERAVVIKPIMKKIW